MFFLCSGHAQELLHAPDGAVAKVRVRAACGRRTVGCSGAGRAVRCVPTTRLPRKRRRSQTLTTTVRPNCKPQPPVGTPQPQVHNDYWGSGNSFGERSMVFGGLCPADIVAVDACNVSPPATQCFSRDDDNDDDDDDADDDAMYMHQLSNRPSVRPPHSLPVHPTHTPLAGCARARRRSSSSPASRSSGRSPSAPVRGFRST